MKKFVRISLVGGGVYVRPLDELINLLDEIEEADTDIEWHIKRIEMTQEEYDNLPEFTGH